LKAGDPDLAADELQAGIERAENKRRELLDARPTERENARVLGLMPRAAELYREQIDLGLGGDLAAAAKARTILRDMLGEIMLSPGEDGSLWAEYAMQPAALRQGAGTGGRGELGCSCRFSRHPGRSPQHPGRRESRPDHSLDWRLESNTFPNPDSFRRGHLRHRIKRSLIARTHFPTPEPQTSPGNRNPHNLAPTECRDPQIDRPRP
jgi:hypothetical protein